MLTCIFHVYSGVHDIKDITQILSHEWQQLLYLKGLVTSDEQTFKMFGLVGSPDLMKKFDLVRISLNCTQKGNTNSSWSSQDEAPEVWIQAEPWFSQNLTENYI